MNKKLKLAEENRFRSQTEIDSLKPRAERYRLGQFSTPRQLADEILEFSKQINPNKKISFLDPAFGTGSFYTALLNSYGNEVERACGFEIDKDYFSGAKETWRDFRDLQLVNDDFTEAGNREFPKFNLVVCNPPYTRHHQLDKETKLRLKKLIDSKFPYGISGLSGLHVYFMLLTNQWVADNGISLWLIPSEVFEVNYGKVLRKYLLEKVDLLRIHFFSQSDVQFDDALVSSCVVAFRHRPKTSEKVEISVGSSLLKPSELRKISKEELANMNKWSKHLVETTKVRSDKKQSSFRLGDFFDIKRGIATGDNDFFILEKEWARSLEIPKKYLINILPSSRYLKGNKVLLDEDGYLKAEKKLVLLDIDLSLEQIEDEYPKLYEYLMKGISLGVDKKYLTSRRTPWYSQERRQPPDFFLRYMSREKNGANTKSLLVENHADAIATNSYLLLYRKKQSTLESQLFGEDIWDSLIEKLSDNLSHFGRTYGGGLVKFEPGELKQISLSI